jgi:hypothetical protein
MQVTFHILHTTASLDDTPRDKNTQCSHNGRYRLAFAYHISRRVVYLQIHHRDVPRVPYNVKYDGYP